MRRLTRPTLALVLGLAAVLALASCGGGGGDLLAGETAEEITQNLERVEELADQGDCVGAEEATAEVAEQVDDLQVDARLQEALEEGVDRLSAAVGDCQDAEEEEEPEETIETIEEPEDEEDGRQKPEAEKKEGKGSEDEQEEPTAPSENGKGKGSGKAEEAPPTEPESESGGVSPAAPAEGE